jgi:uncharacterized protein (DUF427 family)
MSNEQSIRLEPSPKRVRAVIGGETVADSLAAVLVLEKGHLPVYYFPRPNVRVDLLEASEHRTQCPLKGNASYWHAKADTGRVENAAWSYESPIPKAQPIKGHIAFYWDKVDRWLEEDEEVFGHPHDPFHRIDIRPSAREVAIVFSGKTIARSRRCLFLFETGLPTRYYIPPGDVRTELLSPSQKTSICAYKGFASYCSLKVGDRVSKNAVWTYENPLPEYPRIKSYFCFYPEKVDMISVEGQGPVRDASEAATD